MKKNPVLKLAEPRLRQQFGEAAANRIVPAAQQQFESLCAENAAESKAVKAHTVAKIYPAIGLLRALLAEGVPRPEAVAFLDRELSIQAETDAAMLRGLMKIPGLYHAMPAMFRWSTLHNFGEAAGYKANFYDTPKSRVRFDMTRCLFCDVCRKNDCPDLVVCFCHTDDVTNSNMHPRLHWHRTTIMGDGGDCCDFDFWAE